MQETSNRNTENIPTISFSHLLWIFFDAVLKFLKHLILFISRNWVLLLASLITGMVFGYTVHRVGKPQYALTMMVKHTELNPRTFGYMLEDLNQLAATGSHTELSNALHLPPHISSSITSLSGKNLQGLNLTEDTTEQNNKTFLIDATFIDRDIADTLQASLLKYFNNNPFLAKLKNDRIQLNKARLAFINSELQKLDSLKTVYNTFLATSGNNSMFYNNAFNPVEIYKQSNIYQVEKHTLEEWLRQSNQSVVGIDNATPAAVPMSMGLYSSVFLYSILFFLLGCLIAAINAVIKNNR